MVTILSFLFVFSLIIVVHELGHFWAARFCGVRISTFSMGFGPSLLSATDKHGTVWRLRALPLGGYVKFFGDAGAASNPDTSHLEAMRAEIASRYGAEAVAECYHFKPVWQRAIIAAAGPAANFILAFAIFSVAVAAVGEHGFPPVVGAVTPDTPAAAAGLQPGDVILGAHGRTFRYYSDLQRFAALSAGDTTSLTVRRDGRELAVPVTVGRRTVVDDFGGESSMGYIGVALGLDPVLAAPVPGSPAAAAGLAAGDVVLAVDGAPIRYFAQAQRILDDASPGPVEIEVERDGRTLELALDIPPADADAAGESGAQTGEQAGARAADLGFRLDVADQQIVDRPGPFGALAHGAKWTWDAVTAPVSYIARTVTGRESGRELGSVLRIGKFAGAIAEDAYVAGSSGGGVLGGLWSAIGALVLLAGTLSVAIGLFNLLPIPILDGGHLLYYGYEAVAGRPLGEGAQEWGFRIGLALVLGLAIFVTWNDLRYLRVFEAIGNVLS
jgi:regulator of sigma E protease